MATTLVVVHSCTYVTESFIIFLRHVTGYFKTDVLKFQIKYVNIILFSDDLAKEIKVLLTFWRRIFVLNFSTSCI